VRIRKLNLGNDCNNKNMLKMCMDVLKNAVKDCQPTRNFLMDESVDLEVGRRIFCELFTVGVREIEIYTVEPL